MVKIYLDENTGFFYFKIISEERFDTIRAIFQEHYCKFDTVKRAYKLEPNIVAKNILELLQEYTDVEISEDDKALIEMSIYPPSSQVKKVKYSIDKELISKHPPLVGKEGFEDFQKQAILKALRSNRVLLDIEMRHGKTYIMCITIGTLFKLGKLDKVLIVCRLEGVENFRLEILRFLEGIITEEDIGIVTKDNRDIEELFDKKIIITTYSTFRLTSQYYVKERTKSKAKDCKIKCINFDKWGTNRMLLLDECQSINSPNTLQSHFIHLYKDFFERRVSMSGSVGYKFQTMYSQCKFLVPDTVNMNYSTWIKYNSIDKGRTFLPTKVKEFKELVIDNLMTTFKDCIIQPPQIEQCTYVAMGDKMRKLYQKICNSFIQELDTEFQGNVKGSTILSRFGTLSSIVDDPILSKKVSKSEWKFKDNPKLEVLESLLDKYINEENKRVIIWGNHPLTLNLLGEYFNKYKPLVVHGDEKSCGVKRPDRHKVLQEFRKDDSRKILICNQVVSTSISLPEMSVNIYWGLPIDSDYWKQSKSRVRGILQKEEHSITHYLMFSNSIDDYIYYEILLKKDKVNSSISTKTKLSLEDYKNVFNPDRKFYIEGDKL